MTTIAEATAKLPERVTLAKGAVSIFKDADRVHLALSGYGADFEGAAAHALGRVLPMEKAEELPPAVIDEAPDGALHLYDLVLLRCVKTETRPGAIATFKVEGTTRLTAVAKAEESRVIYYVVTAVEDTDAHGHAMTAEEIAEGCWDFPKSFRVKLEHGRPEAMAAWQAAGVCDSMGYLQGAEIVESYLLPVDLAVGDLFHGAKIDQDLPMGSHIAAVRYPLPVWPEFRDTEHGVSWAGFASERKD